jgi:predicted Rossmann-fold nucleotide-binding protein
VVIVAGGGRDLAWPVERIASALLQRSGGRAVHLLLHGGARGADQAIGRAAHQLGWRVQSLAAEWRRFGRCAGPIRNRQLLEQALIEAQAHTSASFSASVLVIAFPGGAGTASLVQQARRSASRSPVPVAVMEVSDPFSPEPLAA